MSFSSDAEPPGAPDSPAPGERIGGYQLVRRIGQGGMGVVYEAVDSTLGRRVALKLISPQLAEDPGFRVRFTHEAQAQASLDSPHVVQVFAHGEADGRLFIASQLIPGGDLGAMVRADGAPPPPTALSLMAQIAEGLAEAHESGLVHRDIKPGNVLLRVREDAAAAYLTDFGIAHRAGVDPDLPLHGAPVGTPTYMAPELHTGGVPGPRTDVYSLGCLLWTTLVGRAPYSGSTDDQLVSAHLSAPIPQLAAGGAWVQEVNRVLRTAMAKHPAERYSSAAAMRDDLLALQRRLPAPVRVVPVAAQQQYGGAPPAPVRTGERAGLLVAVGLAAVLVGGVVTGIARAAGDDDPARHDPVTDEHGLTPEEQAAATSISDALRADGGLAPEEADCTARELVRRTGVDGLRAQGLLDESLEFAGDSDEDVGPQVLSDVFAVAFSCVFEAASTSRQRAGPTTGTPGTEKPVSRAEASSGPGASPRRSS